MGYDNTIQYLYGLQKYGIKLGLDNIVRLLSYFGNPQNSFSSIHVAGTNGKGSTSAMIASILRAVGYKVGLFTSPHLVSFTERIRVNDEEITEQEVIELTEEIRYKMQDAGRSDSTRRLATRRKIPITFFEFVTTMGLLYFKRKSIDWAVVETGMGGRLDATNVLTPKVSVITSVSYDHKEFLGDDISAIVGEKAGVIKEGIPVVCSAQEKAAEDVIRVKATEKSSPLFIYGKNFNGILRSSDINGITFDYSDDNFTIENLSVSLPGEHQLSNACMAIKAAMITLQNSSKFQVSRLRRVAEETSFKLKNIQHSTDFIKEGLAATKWPGRLEFISDYPPILIDGAHNPSASEALAEALRKNYLQQYDRLILILGIMADKDINGIIAPLLPLASEIIFTAPHYSRAASPQLLAKCALAMGFTNIHITPTVRAAIEMAKKCCEFAGSLILITGSFYTIGEAREVYKGKGILSRLRETI